MEIAFTRLPSPELDRCRSKHHTSQPIDNGKALEQHQEFEFTLRGLRAYVHRLPDTPQLVRGVFTDGLAVVCPELAICASICFDSRSDDIIAAPLNALARFRDDIIPFDEPAMFDGSDIIVAGRDVLVGLTSRTNRAALDQVRLVLETELGTYCVRHLRVNGCRHLKSGCSYIGRNTFVVNREWIDTRPLRGFTVIDVPSEEPFGANTLTVHDSVIVPASAPRTADAIARAGFSVLTLDVSEFEKAEGGVGSLCLLFTAIESLMACHT
jgi:dimethylargininase